MKSYHVEIENETNNIIVSYEGDNFESVYDLLLDVLQAYIKKGSVLCLDGFMSADQFDLYVNYSWTINPQAIQGIKKKIENFLKKF